MARALEVAGLSGGEPFRLAAARVVAVRGEEVFAHADGVLDVDDVERVHDMRVATRRLRAALEIFAPCFPRSLHREVLRDVKRLADALGERRDPDVQIQALERFAAEATAGAEVRPAVETLTAQLRDEQARGNATLAAALEEARRTHLRGRLHALNQAAGVPA